jgi:hypothetical protein
MNTVKPIILTMPDGVDRELRFTSGAKKRIVDYFGTGLKDAMDKYDDGALPAILFALMHNGKGEPPAGITEAELAEMLDPADSPEVLAAIMSASSQGQKTKNELEPLIREEMKKRAAMELAKMSGFASGVFAPDLSGLPTNNSGGDTSIAKSPPESSDGASASAEPNNSSEQSPPPS